MMGSVVENILLTFCLFAGVVAETDEVKSVSVSVTEGDPVTLRIDAEMHKDALMLWRFGDKGILLAKIDSETGDISLNNADERFRDRLQLNQNGSLTIKNSRTEHAGLYELQIRGHESSQRFLLSVNGEELKEQVSAYGIASIHLKSFQIITFTVSLYSCPRYRSFFRCYSRNLFWCFSSCFAACGCSFDSDLLSPKDL